MEISGPSGTVSKNSSTVKDAKYADESKEDGFKIASIPNPKKGKHTVKITKAKKGEYVIGSEYADKDGESEEASSNLNFEVKEDMSEGESIEFTVPIDQTNNENPAGEITLKNTVPPTISVQIPEADKTYLNSEVLALEFTVSDDVSLTENILTKIFLDGLEISGQSLKLSTQTLGKHIFKVRATDEDGNQAIQEISFSIKDASGDLPPVINPPTNDNTQTAVSEKKSSKGKKSKKHHSKKKKKKKLKLITLQPKSILGLSTRKYTPFSAVKNNYQASQPATKKMSQIKLKLNNFFSWSSNFFKFKK
jgi:hypothetical protein